MNGSVFPRRHGPWFLKEWRDHRQLTQDALAAMMGTTKPTISKLELYQIFGPGPGRKKIDDKWLARYCLALRVTIGDLLDPPPNGETPLQDLLRNASPAALSQALAEALKRADK